MTRSNARHIKAHEGIEPVLMSIGDTCLFLACGHTRVYELIKTGEIEAVKFGAHRRITTESAKRYVESLARIAPAVSEDIASV